MDILTTYVTVALVSIIDRAGIPTAFVGGLIVARLNGWPIMPLLALCTVAGVIGDILCYSIGMKVTRGETHSSPFELQGWRSRTHKFAVFIQPAPRLWLLFGRVFPAINQFIPLSAALLGYGFGTVFLYCALGNIIWFGLFGLLTPHMIDFFSESERNIQVVAICLGVITVLGSWLANRHIGKRAFDKAV